MNEARHAQRANWTTLQLPPPMISQLKVCDFISTSTSNLPGLLGAAGGRPRRRDTRSGAVRPYPHAAALVPAPRVLHGALTVRRADDSRSKCARSLPT